MIGFVFCVPVFAVVYGVTRLVISGCRMASRSRSLRDAGWLV